MKRRQKSLGDPAMSKSQADDLKDMMVSVVENGSGKGAKVEAASKSLAKR